MISEKYIGTALATAAALAFVTAPVTSTLASAASSKVNCYGVNSCKGQGLMMKTTKQCAKLGGTTEEPMS